MKTLADPKPEEMFRTMSPFCGARSWSTQSTRCDYCEKWETMPTVAGTVLSALTALIGLVDGSCTAMVGL